DFVSKRGQRVSGLSTAHTFQALQRLAERCGAREPPHLVAALREIWTGFNKHVGVQPPWRIALTNGIAIVEKYAPHGDDETEALAAGRHDNRQRADETTKRAVRRRLI